MSLSTGLASLGVDINCRRPFWFSRLPYNKNVNYHSEGIVVRLKLMTINHSLSSAYLESA